MSVVWLRRCCSYPIWSFLFIRIIEHICLMNSLFKTNIHVWYRGFLNNCLSDRSVEINETIYWNAIKYRLHHRRWHKRRKVFFYVIDNKTLTLFINSTKKFLCDVFGLWSFVATHVALWNSLNEHDVFIAHLKRLGSDDNYTSTRDGLSPLKHVGPTIKLNILYKTLRSLNVLSELISKYVLSVMNQCEIPFVMVDISV